MTIRLSDEFPSPRGVELHKPHLMRSLKAEAKRFRPLAGLSCINRRRAERLADGLGHKFPSPRGVELHKRFIYLILFIFSSSFRPLAGLSCINRAP